MPCGPLLDFLSHFRWFYSTFLHSSSSHESTAPSGIGPCYLVKEFLTYNYFCTTLLNRLSLPFRLFNFIYFVGGMMKFVMFPSGVGFFPDPIRHDQFRVFSKMGKREKPIAAGFVFSNYRDETLNAISLQGYSQSLDLDSKNAYPDWSERHERSGVPAVRADFGDIHEKIFFFPFQEFEHFDALSVQRIESTGETTPEDFVEFIERWR